MDYFETSLKVLSKAQFKYITQLSFVGNRLCWCIEIIQMKSSNIFLLFKGFSFYFSDMFVFDIKGKVF